MTVTTPPRRPEIEQDRDLEQRVADLEALIEEARRRARRRRLRNWGATLLVAAAGAAALIGFGGHGGGGAGTAALAQAPGSQSPAANAGSPPLGALPAGVGGAQAFAFDPRNPQIVYILTVGGDAASTGHVFKTTDGGAHWHATATSGSGWVGDIQTLTADPRHPGTLYAGTTVAIYKTVDGGRTWRPYNQGLFPPHGGRPVCYRTGGRSYCVKQPFGTAGTPHFNRGNGWVTAIAVDPANTNIVYSGADAVRKSTDGGHNWKTVFQFDPAGYRWAFNVSALAIAPTRPEAIYAIANASNGRTSHSSIFKSTDAGKTWRATRGKIFTNQDGWGGALAVDPQHPTTVYASIGRTLVRTTDAGASWQPITQGLPQQVVTALTVDPKQPETVYAGLYPTYKKNVISATGGIYKTTNGGDTWTQAFPGITPDAVAVDPARPTTIYAVVKEGLARSTDGGRTWTTAP